MNSFLFVDDINRKAVGKLSVWLAILVFSSSNSIILLLFNIGEHHLYDGRNPINFCNVLLVGNTCACITMILLYRKQWTVSNLKKLSPVDWINLMALSTITGAVVPVLIFYALIKSSVTSTILIGRLEPLVLILLTILFLREKINTWSSVGAFIAFLGVITTFFIQQNFNGMILNKGELFALAAAFLNAISTIISKIRLKHIPLGIFLVVRTGLGILIFFSATAYIYGFSHFHGMTSPFLWKWMVLYGLLIVAGGQVLWFLGIKNTDNSDISLISSFTPIAAIFFAYFLLDETPDLAIFIGGAIIILGMIVGHFDLILDKWTISRIRWPF